MDRVHAVEAMKESTAFAAVLTALVAIPVVAVSGWLVGKGERAAAPPPATLQQVLKRDMAQVGKSDVSWYWVPGPGSSKPTAQDAEMMLGAKTKRDWEAVESFGMKRAGSRYVTATCSTWNTKRAKGDPLSVDGTAAQVCTVQTVPRSAVVAHYKATS